MNIFRISLWPNAKATSAEQRQDIIINSFRDLFSLFTSDVKEVPNKIDQKIITRRWQKTRSRNNTEFDHEYLITLDYDSTDDKSDEVSATLIQNKVPHFLFTTWTHKTIETPQKRNEGKNCFKVVLRLTADNETDLVRLTNGLGALVGKKDIKRVDDISSGIFLGGVHPGHLDDFENVYYDFDIPDEETRLLLLSIAPKEEPKKQDPLDDFEMWDRTVGQKWTSERLQKALSAIKYEEVENFSKMSIWYSLGYALHSTGDNDNFELWDTWCLDNCSEQGVYNREENERFWAKEQNNVPDDHKKLCTLSTLWHLEKLFKAKEDASEIRQTPWTFLDKLADEEPEEIQFLIKDLLVEKSIGFLVGTGGVGKSSMCLEVAKAISAGSDFFGNENFPTNQGTVAIINKEDSYNKIHNQIHNLVELDVERLLRTQTNAYEDFGEGPEPIATTDELRKIKYQWSNVARPAWAQSNIRLTDSNGENAEGLGAVISSLKMLKEDLQAQGKPPLKLVIFDPLNLWHGGDQNSQKDMSYIFSAFSQVQKDLDTAVLIVHHMNKSHGFSGSHTIRDSGRFMWYLRPTLVGKEDSDKYIDLYVEKNNDAKANYRALQFVRTDKGLLDTVNFTEGEEK